MSLDDYVQHMRDRGLSPKTIIPRRAVLHKFLASNSLKNLTERHVLDYLTGLQLDSVTEHKYRQWLNQYFRFVGVSIELPRLKVKEKMLQRSDLVTPDEMKQLLAAMDHPRDRALYHVLWETGARISELIGYPATRYGPSTPGLCLKDIEFGETFTWLQLTGKTGPRQVPIYESVGDLQTWLNYCHEIQYDENIFQGRYGVIKYSWARERLVTISQQVLGRPVTPHLLRHSCVTELSKDPNFSDGLLCKRFGWKPKSSVLARYQHLVSKDLEAATLARHGKHKTEEPAPSPLEPKTCPRCHYTNAVNARYCNQCSLVLDKAEAHQILKEDHEFTQFLEYLHKHKKVLLREIGEEMRKQKEGS